MKQFIIPEWTLQDVARIITKWINKEYSYEVIQTVLQNLTQLKEHSEEVKVEKSKK